MGLVFAQNTPEFSRNLWFQYPFIGGADVRAVQQRLLFYNCRDVVRADGIFGQKTDVAVRLFQRRNGLTPDGVVGRQTWSVLFSSSAKYCIYPTLSRKLWLKSPMLSGPDVKVVQQRLLYYNCLYPDSASGVFDRLTDVAVRDFQVQNGLVPDGVVGPQTWTRLYTDYSVSCY